MPTSCHFYPLFRPNLQGLSFRSLAALERDVAAALGADSFAQLGRGPSLLAGGRAVRYEYAWEAWSFATVDGVSEHGTL